MVSALVGRHDHGNVWGGWRRHASSSSRRAYARCERRQVRAPAAPSRRMPVPARMMRSAVGPEPRSKADPMAVGWAATLAWLDWRWRRIPYASMSRFKDFWSLPACAIAFAVCGEMVLELCPPVAGVPPLLDPPPPFGMHSL